MAKPLRANKVAKGTTTAKGKTQGVLQALDLTELKHPRQFSNPAAERQETKGSGIGSGD
jgi:hypothetical protein